MRLRGPVILSSRLRPGTPEPCPPGSPVVGPTIPLNPQPLPSLAASSLEHHRRFGTRSLNGFILGRAVFVRLHHTIPTWNTDRRASNHKHKTSWIPPRNCLHTQYVYLLQPFYSVRIFESRISNLDLHYIPRADDRSCSSRPSNKLPITNGLLFLKRLSEKRVGLAD